MSYLVLARKWRPRTFDALVGQDHVVRALENALGSGRLHHAWLFTGTRGVGKTTLSRILAKSLNCAQGVTATPCGECQACVEIDAGRYVDYLELDAASNRGVDEMTQLLEQAVYAPSVGRFKVYMIDEVHMLTGHAFNAMLKTLEEPPAHVKFILATTDPQKIPVTVLSRCLQFNLKQLTVPAIVAQLATILSAESVDHEPEALRLLAQSARGSMRDALSLADQAISFCEGRLTAAGVGEMLGTLDPHHLARLLQALAQGDAPGILAVADDLMTRGLSFRAALGDLASVLSRLAIAQRLGHVREDDPLAAEIPALARVLSPDEIQLFYTVAVHSREELALAPDEYAGFVMACLRMLALLPDDRAPAPPVAVTPVPAAAPVEQAPPAARAGAASAVSAVSETPEPARKPAPEPEPTSAPESEALAGPPVSENADVTGPDPVEDEAPPAHGMLAAQGDPGSGAQDEDDPEDDPAYAEQQDLDAQAEGQDLDAHTEDLQGALSASLEALSATPASADAAPAPIDPARFASSDWPALAASLPLTGTARALAMNSEWVSAEADRVHLRVAIHALSATAGLGRLRTVLSEHFRCVLELEVEHGDTHGDTAQAHDQARREARRQAAVQAADAHPLVHALQARFGAEVVSGSVRPPAV